MVSLTSYFTASIASKKRSHFVTNRLQTCGPQVRVQSSCRATHYVSNSESNCEIVHTPVCRSFVSKVLMADEDRKTSTKEEKRRRSTKEAGDQKNYPGRIVRDRDKSKNSGDFSAKKEEQRKDSTKSDVEPESQPVRRKLYPFVDLVLQIKAPLWKVSQLSILPTRDQVLRMVTAPLTKEILKTAERHLMYRKFYQEQLCQIYNHGFAFVNHILMERITKVCWYIYALQLKCTHAQKSDFYVPHHLFIELSLHRKPKTSWFAKQILTEDRAKSRELTSLIPFHEEYSYNRPLKNHLDTWLPENEDKKVEYMAVLLEITIGHKNEFTDKEINQDDEKNIEILPKDDEFLTEAREKLEHDQISLGKICVKHCRPTVII